jgi:hypothetical protein
MFQSTGVSNFKGAKNLNPKIKPDAWFLYTGIIIITLGERGTT